MTPNGYTTVAPWIVTSDTRAVLDFIARVFDGVDATHVPLEDGSIGHAEVRVGDTVLLAFDRREGWPALPALLRVFVPDADLTTAAALAAGARLSSEDNKALFRRWCEVISQNRLDRVEEIIAPDESTMRCRRVSPPALKGSCRSSCCCTPPSPICRLRSKT
jgi:uncharacterized glyoxalase superfamily protein PhnB